MIVQIIARAILQEHQVRDGGQDRAVLVFAFIQRFLGEFALGDIDCYTAQSDGFPLVVQNGVKVGLGPNHPAVFPFPAKLRDAVAAGRDHGFTNSPGDLLIFFGHQGQPKAGRSGQPLCRCVAEHLLHIVTHEGRFSSAIRCRDPGLPDDAGHIRNDVVKLLPPTQTP